MRKVLAIGIVFSLGSPAFAHRLDEYLQASIISLEKDHVEVSMRLVPGVAVSSTVLAGMHANSKGVISEPEQLSYAEQVLRDVSVKVDEVDLHPRVVSVEFPSVARIKEGMGEIRIGLAAPLLVGGGTNRKLVWENR